MAEFIINPNKPNNNIQLFINTPSVDFLKGVEDDLEPIVSLEFGTIELPKKIPFLFREYGAAHAAVSSEDVRVNDFYYAKNDSSNNFASSLNNTSDRTDIDQGTLPWCVICSLAQSALSKANIIADTDINQFINCIPATNPDNSPDKRINKFISDSPTDSAERKLMKIAWRKAANILFDKPTIKIGKISNNKKCSNESTGVISNENSACDIDCILGFIKLYNVNVPRADIKNISNSDIKKKIPLMINFDKLHTSRLLLVSQTEGDISWETASGMNTNEINEKLTELDPDYNPALNTTHILTIVGTEGPNSNGEYTFTIQNSWGSSDATNTITITTSNNIFEEVYEAETYGLFNGITFDVKFTPYSSRSFDASCEYCEKFCKNEVYNESNGQETCTETGYAGIRLISGGQLGVPISKDNFCDCVCDHPKKTYDADLQTCICDPNLAGPCEGVDNPLSLKLYDDSCDCVCQPENATQYCASQEERVFDSETCSCVAYGAWCTIYEACDDNFYINGCTEGTLNDWVKADNDNTAESFNTGKTCAEISCVIDPSPTCTLSNTPTPSVTVTSTPTETLTLTPTTTSTSTPTNTSTPTATVTLTSTPTQTATLSNTPTSTPTQTATLSNTPTSTPTQTATLSNTPTSTPTQTATLSNTPTSTPTQTATLSNTPTSTPTQTATLSNTPTSTPTQTATATATPTPTATSTASLTPTSTSTSTSTPAPTSTSTSTPNPTPTSSYNILGGQWYTMIP